MKSEVEELELIAKRVPPGDNWELEMEKGAVINGLVPTLSKYSSLTGFKGDYRLSPLEGKLYIITLVGILPPEPEKYNIYGEY